MALKQCHLNGGKTCLNCWVVLFSSQDFLWIWTLLLTLDSTGNIIPPTPLSSLCVLYLLGSDQGRFCWM